MSRKLLIEEINSLPRAERRMITSEATALLDKELSSGQEYHGGFILLNALPYIADDDLLAKALRPYLDSREKRIRTEAVEALSNGRGPASGRLLSEKIARAFEKLPRLPLRTPEEEDSDSLNEVAEVFFSCLKGLLRAESAEFRDVGRRYFTLFRNRYSSDEEGSKLVATCFAELDKLGLANEINIVEAPASKMEEVDSPNPQLPSTEAQPLRSSSAYVPAAGTQVKLKDSNATAWRFFLAGGSRLVFGYFLLNRFNKRSG